MSVPEGFGEAAPARVPMYRIDLGEVDSKAALLQAFAQALSLDADWGRNWDALYDALTDLNTDTAFELVGQAAFASAHAPLWNTLEGVLLDAQDFLSGQGVGLCLVK